MLEITEMEFFIVKGDLRQNELCRLLQLDGHRVSLVESLESATRTAGAGTVAVVSAAVPQARLELEANGVRVIEYSKCEACVQRQASITAETALLSAVLHSKRTVRDSDVMIIGFGRIGKELTRLLGAWGCKPVICVRKQRDLDDIAAAGHKGVHIDEMNKALPQCNLLFNTVPAPVLDSGRLALLIPQATVIDLASKPGGVDFEAAAGLGINAVHALALPGKLAPITSAAAIKRAVYDELGI